jgi:hypothetical protein
MALASILAGIGAHGGSASPAPGDVTAIAVTGTVDPDTGVVSLQVGVTPPVSLGTFVGGDLFVEIPDISGITPFIVGSTPVGGGAVVTGPWSPIPLGRYTFAAGDTRSLTFPLPAGLDPTVAIGCRLYVDSFSKAIENKLVQAGLTGATPSQTFTITPQSAPSASGTNVTSTGGPISAIVLADDTSTGKRKTPVLVTVDAIPDIPGWAAEFLLVWGDADPTDPKNQQIVGQKFNNSGPIYTSGDGIVAPHTFSVDTPKTMTYATIYMVAGLSSVRARSAGRRPPGVSHSWNNVVPGITPSWRIALGSILGTLDLTAAYNYSTEFHIDPVTGKWSMANPGLDMTKALNLSAQFAVVGGLQTLTNVSADLLISGKLQIGGGTNKVSLAKFFDTQSTPVLMGFIGDDSAGSGYVGSWFIRMGIGGTGPLAPAFFCDSAGNTVAKSIFIGDATGQFGFIGPVPGMAGAATGYAWFKNIGIGGPNATAPKIMADANGNLQIQGSLVVGTVGSAAVAVTITGTLSVNQIASGTIVNQLSIQTPYLILKTYQGVEVGRLGAGVVQSLVNISGTTVTLAGGDGFTSRLVGQYVNINGISVLVTAFTSASQISIFTNMGTLNSASMTFDGGWVQQFAFGGTRTAPVGVSDRNGNVSLVGATFSLNSGGVTTTIANTSFTGPGVSGIKISLNVGGLFSAMAPNLVGLWDGSGNPYVFLANAAGVGSVSCKNPSGSDRILLASNGLQLTDSSSNFGQLTATQLQLGSSVVVQTRRTGWSAWTGTATRSSVATGAATALDCAKAIKALTDDLIAHGLIGA